MTRGNNRADEGLDRISRRKIMAALGGSAAMGLAGCSGSNNTETTETTSDDGDGGGNETATASSTGEPLDPTMTVSQTVRLATEMQWNPYHQEKGLPNEGRQLEWVNMGVQLVNGETFPILLSDYSLDGTTATLEMNDWFTWTNGDDVTGKDLETQLYLSIKMGQPGFSDISDVHQTGDYTVEITADSEKNEPLFWSGLLKYGNSRPRDLHTPHSVFKEYREKFEDATTDDEEQAVFEELGTWTYDEEPLGYGPYHINPDRTTEEKMVFERNDDYPLEKVQAQFAEALDYDVSDWPAEHQIPEWEVLYSGERQTELVLSDTLDFSGLTTITEELKNQAPDHMEFHGIERWGGGTALLPNLDNEHFGKRRVRQAVAHLIPFEQSARLMYGQLAEPESLQTSLAAVQEKNWLSEDLRTKLNQYERDEERAAELMREAGYTLEGGVWHDGDGNAIDGGGIPIPSSLSQKVKAFSAIAQQITDFGIPIEVQTTDWSAYSTMVNDRDFNAFAHAYFGGGPHPYNAYGGSFGSTWWDEQTPWYEGEELTIPDIDNPDDTMSINPVSLMQELQTKIPEERQVEIVERLAWTFNHELPLIGLTFKEAAAMRTNDHWRVPSTDDKMSGYPVYWHLQNYLGLVQPKFEN